MSKKKGKIVACLDMGSSKLVCIIAAVTGDEVQILGHAYKESKGINSSAISDMRLAQKAITSVVSQAEKMAGFNIDRLLVGISGIQVSSIRKEISIKISSDIVRPSDISGLAEKIRGEFRKNNREIVHLIPLQYRLDDSPPVLNPRYMSGEKLHARFHIISTSQTTIRNIENCFKRCQISVSSYMVEPYASALSCLSENEINLGVMLIDIGYNSTSFSIIIDGNMVFVGSCPIGGYHITKDISTIFGVSLNVAEKIKTLNSSLLISPIEEREIIKYRVSEGVDESGIIKITKLEMCQIIRTRLEEIFESIKESLNKKGLKTQLLSNIVLCGGVAVTVGVDKLASEIFEKNVRIGYPNKFPNAPAEILNQSHSCSLGMLIFLQNLYLKEKIKDGFETKDNWFRRLVEKLAAF